MGGISAKPQHRCTDSIDDAITEDQCAQPDCLFDEETGLWNDDNCPGDQVCMYAHLCVAKPLTFPGGMPEGLQLAPASGGGGGLGPGPLAASTSIGALGRSSPLSTLQLKGGDDDIDKKGQQQQMESTVAAANHVRRPHGSTGAVSLDQEDG